MRVQLEVNSGVVKKVLLVLAIVVVVGVAGIIGYKLLSNKNPLPSDVKRQLSFPAIYPKNSSSPQSAVDQSSISYQPAEKTLTFSAQDSNTNIILTEQPATGDTSNPNLVYYESLGLHPVTEIQTNLGLAVVVNFYTTGDFNSAGQNAILAKNGTLLIARPAKNLSPETWKSFFNSLHIYK